MDKISVLVTGIGGGGHGEQIVKALRLGKLSYNIIGTDVTSYCSGRALVNEFREVPYASSDKYLDIILGICEEFKIKAIFHGSEQEMVFLGKNRKIFEDLNIYLPINSEEVFNICQNKVRTMEHLAKLGINMPKFIKLSKAEDIHVIDFMYPIIVKPSVGGGGSNNVFVVQNFSELKNITEFLFKYNAELVLQEYIGTPDNEFTVGVLFGEDGQLINSIAVKRIIENALSRRTMVPNLTGRTDLGSHLVISSGVSSGHIARWSSVTTICEKIAKSLNPTAPINIQCRKVGNEIIPFEINPRFSGTTSLRAMVGYNEPDILIRKDILGEKISTHFPYENGIIMRGLVEYSLEEK